MKKQILETRDKIFKEEQRTIQRINNTKEKIV